MTVTTDFDDATGVAVCRILGAATRVAVIGSVSEVAEPMAQGRLKGVLVDASQGHIDVSEAAWLDMWEEAVAAIAAPVAYIPELGWPDSMREKAVAIARDYDRPYEIFEDEAAALAWLAQLSA